MEHKRSAQAMLEQEKRISLQAGEVVRRLYAALLRQCDEPEAPETLHSLNALCVRLVFCLYAEDAGVFGRRGMLADYLNAHREDAGEALRRLFAVLNTHPDARTPGMEAELAAFPYVNGGLFAEDGTTVPTLPGEVVEHILWRAHADFDWSHISPTIFGAVFESTLNPETRRRGGMHYTSLENIHKVIDPLFLDALQEELASILHEPHEARRRARLQAFQENLAALRFLDPACGSGNFLTEAYICLRRLENEVISRLNRGQGVFALEGYNPIRVGLHQFYGIELNGFAATVARAALWIAEHQMLRETEAIVRANLEFLPLKTYANIVEGNALRMDWESLVPRHELHYIMGNPPFVGGMMMSRQQHEELRAAFPECIRPGETDYLAGWYAKAARMIQGTSIRCAFVSTNSLCQGQSVAVVWAPLMAMGVHIDFAHRSFCWDSEANVKSHVHVIIIGFSVAPSAAPRLLFDGDSVEQVHHINAYLMDAEDVFIESRREPLCPVPPMYFGSMPRDGGGFILSEEEAEALLVAEPAAAPWLRPFVGAAEFINGRNRRCLWLVGATPEQVKASPEIHRRVEQVRAFRAGSKAAATRRFAETPTLFCQIAQPESDYIIVPSVSSERRAYVPLGFLPASHIASNAVLIIPGASHYHFGVLTSRLHMEWIRACAGRLKSDYRYSKDIVYNNFPWPDATPEEQAAIAGTARGILEARALYPESSLAELYDEHRMPPELREAHQQNDRAVAAAYGITPGTPESTLVAELMRRYRRLAEGDRLFPPGGSQ